MEMFIDFAVLKRTWNIHTSFVFWISNKKNCNKFKYMMQQ